MEPAVVLDAAASAEQVRGKLSLYPRDTWYVIRDNRAAQLRWYVLDGWDLSDATEVCEADQPLNDFVDLEGFGADVRQASDRDRPSPASANAVVLDGTEVVGVLATSDHVIPGIYREWLPSLCNDDPAARLVHFFAWPSVAAPSTAMRGDDVVLTITLSQEQQPSSPIYVRLLPDEREFDLEIDVAAIGFDAPKGWRHKLAVDTTAPSHSVVVPLRVRDDVPPGRIVIHVAFLKGGIVCGYATCVIAVGLAAAEAAPGQSSPCVLPGTDDEAADLLVMIRTADGDNATGRYVWSTSSTRVTVDSRPYPIDLGTDARTFARSLMRDMVDADGTALLEPVLKSIAKEIAAHVPAAFWEALRLTAAAIAVENRPPSVLLYSAEEFVPWELAFMEQPLGDGAPYLAAQVTLGRWLHSQTGAVPPRPPWSIASRDIAILAPDYETVGEARLERALAEARYMVEAHGAIAINATEDDVRRLLDAEVARGDGSPAEIGVVHYAGHGSSDPTRPGSAGLFLVNGKRLSPRIFGATMLGSRFGPLLFINACEVGMGQRLLDDNAGFAAIALRGGFRGFIAPLWAVRDDGAEQVARQFYERTLGENPGEVGSVLRDLRHVPDTNRDATPISYIYYGHPRLLLRR